MASSGSSDFWQVLKHQALIFFLFPVLLSGFFITSAMIYPCKIVAATFQLRTKNPTIQRSDPSATRFRPNLAAEELPDLTIRSTSVDNRTPKIGTKINIEATLYNLGQKEGKNIVVRFSYQGRHQDKKIRLINSQRSTAVSAEITIVKPAGTQIIDVTVNPGRDFQEVNHNNNSKRQSIQAKKPTLSLNQKTPELKRKSRISAIQVKPDIISFQPRSIEQGTMEVVKVRKKNVSANADIDFGECISQVGPPIPGDYYKIPISVSADCPSGPHNVIIRQNQMEFTASAKLYITKSQNQPTSPDQDSTSGLLMKPLPGAPDVTEASPDSLIQGSTQVVNLKAKNISSKFRFDFGTCITQIGPPDFRDRIAVKLKVAQDCPIGHHPIKLKYGRNIFSTSSSLLVTAEGQQPMAFVPEDSPIDIETKPDSITKKPSLSMTPKKPFFTFIQPNRWEKLKKYRVSLHGQNLDKVTDIEFGTDIVATTLDRISDSLIQVDITITQYAQIGHRDIIVYSNISTEEPEPNSSGLSLTTSNQPEIINKDASYGEKPTHLDGWVISPPKKQMPVIKRIIPEISIPNIELYTPEEKLGMYPPELSEKSYFTWAEKSDPIAEEFTLLIMTKDGTVLFHHTQAATEGNPGYNTIQTYPYIADYHPGYDPGVNITELLVELHERLAQYKGGSLAGGGLATLPTTGLSQQATITSDEQSLSLKKPIITDLNLSQTEATAGSRNSTLLYWQVLGNADGRQVAYSEKRPVRLGGVSPTGLLCETSNNTNDLQAIPQGDPPDLDDSPANRPEEYDVALYPGQVINIAGKFTLANCPWKVSVHEIQKDIHWENRKISIKDYAAFPIGATYWGYTFDNVFIDWGDGSSEPIKATLVKPKETGIGGAFGQTDVFRYDELMQLDMDHQYNYPGTYAVRVYVLPVDDMGARQSVANLNNESIASLNRTTAQQEWVLLAAANIPISDAGNGLNATVSNAQQPYMPGAEASKRAYQVYCNPLHIYVPQDTVATGPLQLKDIEITTFSINQDPAAKPSRGFQTNQTKPAQLQQQSPKVLTLSKSGNQLRRAADAYVSECDYGLWAEANLNYLGQGYVQIDWMLDNQVIGSEQLPIGPSELRTDMYLNPDSEPIVTGHQFRSPKLAIDQLSENQQSRLHEVTVSAKVVPDPTMSSVNSVALIAGLTGSNNQTIPLPPPGDDPIDISSLYDINSSGNKRVYNNTGSITQAIHQRFSGPSFDLAPPYKVVSTPKTYLVSKKPAGQPCFFRFPVENGYFIIANLRNLKKSGNSYSGDGSLIFNLPDSSVSVKEHFVPIAFTGWQVNGDVVQVGNIDTPTDTQLDNLPGLKAHLGHLTGIAGIKLDATLDVEMHDPTLYQAYSQSASGQKWSGLTAPLSPEGDWYSPPQRLNLTRIGWSLVNIEATDNVRIDLSHNEGKSACNTYNPINPFGWVGIHFGPDAVVYPYTFNLVNTLSIPAPGWGVVSTGICGTAKTTPDQQVESSFGKAGGKIRWSSIEIAAHNGDVTSTYDGLQVDMTWPQVSLVGNASFTYTGQTVDPQLLLEPMGGNSISEEYGVVDMALDNLKFESKNKVWGLSGDGKFTFKEEQNSFTLDVPGLFFTMDNEAQFSDQTQLQANITGHEPSDSSIGGANIVLNNAALATGIRSLQFTHHATLNLGRELKGSPTTIGYNVFSNGNSAENMTSKGPIVGTLEGTIDVTINGGNTNDVSTAVLTDVTYLKQDNSGTMAGCTDSNSLLAYNTYGGSVSDGWPDFSTYPLLVDNGNGSALNPCSDTFSGRVETSLLSSSSKVSMMFRYGDSDGDTYWKMSVDAGNNIPYILVFSGVFVQFQQGGIGYNLPSESILGTGCPDPDGSGLTLAAGVRMKVISESVFAGNAEFIVAIGEQKITMLMDNITLIGIDMGGTTGITTFSASAFDSTILVDESFLNDQVHLTGASGIRIAGDWYVFVGAAESAGKKAGEAPASASFFGGLIEGNGRFKFDSSGFNFHLDAGYGLKTPTVFDCSAGINGNVTGDFAIQIPSFNFGGSLSYYGDIGLHTPLGYLGEKESLGIDVGCCSPTQLNFHWSKSVCAPCVGGPEAGFSIDLLPSLDFRPWAHWTHCGCFSF